MNAQELEFRKVTMKELLNDNRTSIQDVVDVIEQDFILAQRIIETSNSVLYGDKRRKLIDLRSAIIRIGFRNVKRIIVEYIAEKEEVLLEGEVGA